MALGLLAGLVVGSGAALVVDRRTGLVFSLDELQALLPAPAQASAGPQHCVLGRCRQPACVGTLGIHNRQWPHRPRSRWRRAL